MKTNLSTYIQNDLRLKILSGAGIPDKLTLPALAAHYEVSLMPVRLAVQELLAERLLSKQENGRLAVNPAKVMTQRKVQAPPPPPTDWFQVVLKDVLQQSLCGRAAPLKIVKCAEKYGISRSLMHTIFHRLAGQGLIEHTPRQGWSIRPFREHDLDSYVDVRETLELLALDSARDNLENDKLRALLELNQPGPARGPARIDNTLHAYWVARSENRYVQDFFERHHAYYDLLLTHAVIRRQHIEESQQSHCRILQALIRKDWLAARAELVQDIRRLKPLLKATIHRLEAAQ